MAQEPRSGAPAGDPGEQVAVKARLDELLGSRSEREVALVTRLVVGFPAKASGLVHGWSTATLEGDHEEAARAVHTLKGTALNLGSSTLSDVCEEIESRSPDKGRDGESVQRERLVSAVAAFARTLAEVASALAIGDRATATRSDPPRR